MGDREGTSDIEGSLGSGLASSRQGGVAFDPDEIQERQGVPTGDQRPTNESADVGNVTESGGGQKPASSRSSSTVGFRQAGFRSGRASQHSCGEGRHPFLAEEITPRRLVRQILSVCTEAHPATGCYSVPRPP